MICDKPNAAASGKPPSKPPVLRPFFQQETQRSPPGRSTTMKGPHRILRDDAAYIVGPCSADIGWG